MKVLAVACALFLAACGSPFQPEWGGLKVSAYERLDNRPVQDVVVVVGGSLGGFDAYMPTQPRMTNENGEAFFTAIPVGAYLVTGFRQVTAYITLRCGFQTVNILADRQAEVEIDCSYQWQRP